MSTSATASLLFTLVTASSLAAQQVPTLALSAPTATAKESFTDVNALFAYSDDKVLVTDEKERRLVLLDLTSGKTQAVSRIGAGPREYRMIGPLFPRAGGGAVAVDFIQRRLLPVAADGALQDAIPFPFGVVLKSADASSRLYGTSFLRIPGKAIGDTMLLVRFDPVRGTTDTLFGFNARFTGIATQGERKLPVWRAQTSWAPLPNGDIVMLDGRNYTFTWYAADGKTQRSVQVPWEAPRVTEQDKAAMTAYMKAHPPQMMGGGAPSGPPPELALDFPSVLPVTDIEDVALMRAPDGMLWVHRLQTLPTTRSTYDVFDPAGKMVRHVTFPPSTLILAFGPRTIFVTEKNADDEILIRRYAAPSWTGQ